VTFVKGPRGQSPEDALLVQFQGMIAEYERAQILERTRRGKTHRARAGTVNVLSGAPFGYRYVRKSEHADAGYEIAPHEAAIVAELFARYADGGVAIAELTRWLSGMGVPTRSGKTRWDRSVIWSMLRNPAYAGGPASARPCAPSKPPGSTAPLARPGGHPPQLHRHRPGPAGLARDPRASAGRRGHLGAGPAAAGGQQALRLAQQQGSLAAARDLRLFRLRLRLLPHLDAHLEHEDLLLPLSRLGRLPLRARPDLRQQAGARRLPRHPRLGPHHHSAHRPRP